MPLKWVRDFSGGEDGLCGRSFQMQGQITFGLGAIEVPGEIVDT